ncbi:MAG: GbsR/MarR family transcriptional regulator [Candidatus Aenigmarchaeota archaeon]|nr:GbsR/MarR family transcriptional regulator [Candidatus Aenigmarchaeota archaeon]
MKTKDIEKGIYTTFAEIATAIGYSEIHGRVIGALLVSNKKLSLNELAKKTGYSLSTVSLSLDLLEFLGMIKKTKKAGDRKLYVELHGNLLEGLKKAFIMRIQKSIDGTLAKFDEYKDELEIIKDGEEKKNVMKALNILEDEVNRVNKYVGLLHKLK